MERLMKLKPIERNKLLWLSGLPLRSKLAFYPRTTISYLNYIGLKKKHVTYLGERFYFDNIATPLCLMTYPHEVRQQVAGNIDKDIKTVLDIGGNIGQFSLTALKLLNPKSIDTIEPNPEIFKILEKNLSKHKNVKLYNVGIGPAGQKDLFFEEGRSGLGSIMKDNAGKRDKIHGVTVKLVSDISKLTGKKKYDLVKIDVEGYEFGLLDSIKKIDCKYLFIEFSSGKRKTMGQHSESLSKIREKFGDFKILHVTESSATSPSFEMLLQFS